jgi:hypothetical protein
MEYHLPVPNNAIDDFFGSREVVDERSDLPVDRADLSLGNEFDDLLARDFLLVGGQRRLLLHGSGAGSGVVHHHACQCLALIPL